MLLEQTGNKASTDLYIVTSISSTQPIVDWPKCYQLRGQLVQMIDVLCEFRRPAINLAIYSKESAVHLAEVIVYGLRKYEQNFNYISIDAAMFWSCLKKTNYVLLFYLLIVLKHLCYRLLSIVFRTFITTTKISNNFINSFLLRSCSLMRYLVQ